MLGCIPCIFTDSKCERQYLRKHVLPCLRKHCQSLGLQFHAVDLYVDVPLKPECTSAMYKLERSGVLQLALKEIKLCQCISAGPSFVVRLSANPCTFFGGCFTARILTHSRIHHFPHHWLHEWVGSNSIVDACPTVKPWWCTICYAHFSPLQTLLAQRYGHKPLHLCIPEEEFGLLYAAVEDPTARKLLQKWYKLDTNARPPNFVLQSGEER